MQEQLLLQNLMLDLLQYIGTYFSKKNRRDSTPDKKGLKSTLIIMHSCNIPQTNSNLLVGQLQLVFKQFTLNEKSCSTSTQKTGKVKIIQTFVSVKSSAWDTVSLSNRLYFTTSKNKQRYNTLSKNSSEQEPSSHSGCTWRSTTLKKQMVQIKRVTTS